MMQKISLTFSELTPAAAAKLIEFYQSISDAPQMTAPQIAPQMAPVQAAPQMAAPQQPAVQIQPDSEIFDIDGVPYNPNLHASRGGESGGKSQDGRWRMKRGAERKDYLAWRDQHAKPPAQVGQAPQVVPMIPVGQAPQVVPTMPVGQAPQIGQAPQAYFPGADVRGENTTVNGEVDPGRDAVIQKARDLTTQGLLTAQAVTEIMRAAGTNDNVELVNIPAKRIVAWRMMLALEAQNKAPAIA